MSDHLNARHARVLAHVCASTNGQRAVHQHYIPQSAQHDVGIIHACLLADYVSSEANFIGMQVVMQNDGTKTTFLHTLEKDRSDGHTETREALVGKGCFKVSRQQS